MIYTITDILNSIPLPENKRTSLLSRISDIYKIEPDRKDYRKYFSKEKFDKIVKMERERLKNIIPNNSRFLNKSRYISNRKSGVYSRLTDYGGVL